MPRLVERRNFPVLLRHDAALFLRADSHFNKGPVNVALHQILPAFSGSVDGCLVHQVFQIRPGEAGGRLRHPVKIHVLSQGFHPGMNRQNLLPALHVRSSHYHLAVKSSRP